MMRGAQGAAGGAAGGSEWRIGPKHAECLARNFRCPLQDVHKLMHLALVNKVQVDAVEISSELGSHTCASMLQRWVRAYTEKLPNGDKTALRDLRVELVGVDAAGLLTTDEIVVGYMLLQQDPQQLRRRLAGVVESRTYLGEIMQQFHDNAGIDPTPQELLEISKAVQSKFAHLPDLIDVMQGPDSVLPVLNAILADLLKNQGDEGGHCNLWNLVREPESGVVDMLMFINLWKSTNDYTDCKRGFRVYWNSTIEPAEATQSGPPPRDKRDSSTPCGSGGHRVEDQRRTQAEINRQEQMLVDFQAKKRAAERRLQEALEASREPQSGKDYVMSYVEQQLHVLELIVKLEKQMTKLEAQLEDLRTHIRSG